LQILVATSGDQGERMGVFDEQLRQLMQEDAKPDRADPASGSHAVSRVTFRQVMLAGLDDAVHFGQEFTHYVQAGDGTGSSPSPTRTRSSSSTSPPRPRSSPGRTPA
jgi:hypothetical protein